MKKPREFEFLLDAFKSLPGVGSKSALRYTFYLINQDKKYKEEFASRILDISNNIKKCNLCNNIANGDICTICSDNTKNKTLCIVSTFEDLERIDESHNYNGYYHIIGYENNIKNYKLTNINIDLIKKQIVCLSIKEVIIATNFSLVGEAASQYINNNLSTLNGIDIYRLGFGIPLNASIDYIDDETIKESLINKKKLN